MGCSLFEQSLAEQWPEWPSNAGLADHVRNCPECSASVRIQARVANILEGIGGESFAKPELVERIKRIGKKVRRSPKSKASGWWMAVSLVLVALLAQWHVPPSRSPEIGAPASREVSAIGMVNARQVTEEGARVLDKALAVMEPLALATTSAITRVLYEVTEPILTINKS